MDAGQGRLPERFGDGEVQLRRCRVEDAETLHRLVSESVKHLRPWMGWVAAEPLSLDERRRMLEQWEHNWRAGGDVLLGIFRGGVAAGGCGLLRSGSGLLRTLIYRRAPPSEEMIRCA